MSLSELTFVVAGSVDLEQLRVGLVLQRRSSDSFFSPHSLESVFDIFDIHILPPCTLSFSSRLFVLRRSTDIRLGCLHSKISKARDQTRLEMNFNLSLYSINAFIILDSEGHRVLAKYYRPKGHPQGESKQFLTLKEQKAFEKGLWQKTKKVGGNA